MDLIYFYGSVKGGKYKWLDIKKMCQFYYPHYNILSIKYFTALVTSRPDNTDSPINQQIYLRALRTLPNFNIILGHFKDHVVRRPLVVSNLKGIRQKVSVSFLDIFNKRMSLSRKRQSALIKKTEEKGSDVNLSVNLVNDAHLDKFDTAIVISNDSDLASALRVAKKELRKTINILNPYSSTVRDLQKVSSSIKYINKYDLNKFQFLDVLEDKKGFFHKPREW